MWTMEQTEEMHQRNPDLELGETRLELGSRATSEDFAQGIPSLIPSSILIPTDHGQHGEHQMNCQDPHNTTDWS